jgi:hypothetical protein
VSDDTSFLKDVPSQLLRNGAYRYASQALFVCQQCCHTDNADRNAACVLKKRAIKLLVEQKVVFKQKKTARVRGQKKSTVGPVRPEPGECVRPTPAENMSDGVGGHAANDATFRETGNRHLGDPSPGGR